MKPMDFRKVLAIIARAARQGETVEIWYPRTERSVGGWRQVEPYCLATDVGRAGEHLVYGEDLLSPGHILNAYTIGSGDDHCDSFVISKIKAARPAGRKFKPRRNWQIEF